MRLDISIPSHNLLGELDWLWNLFRLEQDVKSKIRYPSSMFSKDVKLIMSRRTDWIANRPVSLTRFSLKRPLWDTELFKHQWGWYWRCIRTQLFPTELLVAPKLQNIYSFVWLSKPSHVRPKVRAYKYTQYRLELALKFQQLTILAYIQPEKIGCQEPVREEGTSWGSEAWLKGLILLEWGVFDLHFTA